MAFRRFTNLRRRSSKRRAVAIIALLGGGFVVAAGIIVAVGGRSSEKTYERALEYRQQGEFSASIIELKNALQKDPKNIAARISLGQIYLEIRDLASAEKELQRARTYGADVSVIVAPLSRTWLSQRNYQKVLDELSPEGLDAATRANVLVAHGRAHAGLMRPDQAREAIEQALQADPQNAAAWIETARLAINGGDFAAAEEALNRLIKLAPDNLEATALRGDLYLKSGKYGDAVAQYEAVIARLPAHMPTKVALANAFMAQGIDAEATRILEAALRQAPTNADASYLNAVIAFKNEDYGTALSSAERALLANPGHLPSLLIAGSSEFVLGRLELAERDLKQVLAQDPDHPFATQLLLATRERRAIRARERTRAALIDDSSTPAAVASAIDPATHNQQIVLVGLAYLDGRREGAKSPDPAAENGESLDDARRLLASNDAEKAIELLLSALERSPDSAQIKAVLGETYLHQGRAADAFRVVEAGLLGREASAEGLTVAAIASLLTNRANQARLSLRALDDREPAAVEVQYLLSLAYNKLGDDRAYKDRLERSLAIDPDFAPAVAEKMRFALEKSHLDKAEDAARKLDRLWSERPVYLELLAGLALLRREGSEAAALYRQAFDMEPTTVRALRLAYVEHRSGRAAESRAVLENWLQTNPGDTAVALALANKRLTSGEFVDAAELYSAILRQVPDHVVAINNLAWVSLQLGDNDVALRLAQQGLELAPDDPHLMDTLAEIFISEERYAEALPLLKRAALRDSENAGLQVRLARALAQTGSPTDARELLKKVLDANPEFPERQEAERLSTQLEQ